MVQTADTGQETVVEHEVIRTAFDSLFAAVETAPHNLERGIRLWHDGRPKEEAKSEKQLREETIELLECQVKEDPDFIMRLVNEYRVAAELDKITEVDQVVIEENINLLVQARLQKQEEYAAFLPFRIPDDQLYTLGGILTRIGILPEGYAFASFSISIQASEGIVRSDEVRITGILIFNGGTYPTVAKHEPKELIRELHLSIARNRGMQADRSSDYFDLSVRIPLAMAHIRAMDEAVRQSLITESQAINGILVACRDPLAERCGQKRFVTADLDLLTFLEGIVKQIKIE